MFNFLVNAVVFFSLTDVREEFYHVAAPIAAQRKTELFYLARFV